MVVVCKPILVFNFDFGQAEQYKCQVYVCKHKQRISFHMQWVDVTKLLAQDIDFYNDHV